MQKYLRIRRGVLTRATDVRCYKSRGRIRSKPCRFKMSNAANVSCRSRPFWPSCIALLLFTLILTSMTLQRVSANPLLNFTQKHENLTTESSTEISAEDSIEISIESVMDDSSTDNSMDSSMDNSTEIASNTDVYVIKAVVYEIGILTDTDNTTSSESTERLERVDISLYNAPQEDEFS